MQVTVFDGDDIGEVINRMIAEAEEGGHDSRDEEVDSLEEERDSETSRADAAEEALEASEAEVQRLTDYIDDLENQ